MNDQNFLVAAIGTSAGGVKALAEFFGSIPAHTQSAFVVVMHLLRDHTSRLDHIIRKQAKLPVVRADKDMSIEPGKIYVIPENTYLIIRNGKLTPTEREEAVLNNAVNVFFKSLADGYGKRAIGIILSGVGSDGLEGVKKIEDEGGIVFVQDPDSTRFSGMPLSIIKFNHPDVIATPAEIAKFVVSYEKSFARDEKYNG